MKNYFNFIFFVILVVCNCACVSVEDSYIGNPDDTAEIERPCKVFDLNCIREFFAKHARCYITRGPIPDPLYKSQQNYEVPHINLTLTLVHQMVTGLNNARIEEFYINRKTNRLVFSVEFRQIGISSNNTYYIFNRRAKEPIVNVALGSVFYQSVVITAVFPHADDLRLDNAEIVIFSNDAIPPFILGPNVVNSTDPIARITAAEFFSDTQTDVQELFLGDVTFYLSSYIQYNICDFGLQL